MMYRVVDGLYKRNLQPRSAMYFHMFRPYLFNRYHTCVQNNAAYSDDPGVTGNGRPAR